MTIPVEFIAHVSEIDMGIVTLEPREAQNEVDLAQREDICRDRFRREVPKLHAHGTDACSHEKILVRNSDLVRRNLRDFSIDLIDKLLRYSLSDGWLVRVSQTRPFLSTSSDCFAILMPFL